MEGGTSPNMVLHPGQGQGWGAKSYCPQPTYLCEVDSSSRLIKTKTFDTSMIRREPSPTNARGGLPPRVHTFHVGQGEAAPAPGAGGFSNMFTAAQSAFLQTRELQRDYVDEDLNCDSGVMTYVGQGNGSFMKETTYRYVGSGGDYHLPQKVNPSFKIAVCCALGALLLLPFVVWLSSTLPRTQPSFDCSAGDPKLEGDWSAAKRDWCCNYAKKGCRHDDEDGTQLKSRTWNRLSEASGPVRDASAAPASGSEEPK